jgi:HD-GYP domain-containing protein (c-di-GMP phosphodiesterase class II)
MGEDLAGGVRPAELIAAVSLATDIGMAQPLETGLAVCLVAVELAGRLGHGPQLRQRAFHLALLQHIGCTVASAPVAAVLGDELVMRGHAATLDFADQAAMFRFLLAHVGRVNPPLARPAALARALAGGRQVTGTMAGVCEGAMMLGERFGCGADSLRDIGCVYEYWDGKGFPHGLAGAEITEPACVVQVATLAVAAHHAGGTAAAVSLAGQRRGHSLAPAAAAAFLADPGGLLARVETPVSLWDAVLEAEPLPSVAGPAGADQVDRMLRAVADFVDLKSPWLAGHSSGVAALAATAAEGRGLPPDEVVAVRRAGWLHDIGRVGVSSAVWGHRGPLSAHQWEQVRLHPYHTSRVLDRSPYLRKLGAVAAAHHERLDGSGYFRGATAGQLPAAARVLAAADAYHAMTEPRPHRPAHPAAAAAAEVRSQAQAGRLDAAAVEAVLAAAGHRASRRATAAPAGLTPREVETLRLVARGLSIRQIARSLSIAPKTADGHIQRIYAKTGVSTRAGATLFALSHDLLPPGGAEDRENSP